MKLLTVEDEMKSSLRYDLSSLWNLSNTLSRAPALPRGKGSELDDLRRIYGKRMGHLQLAMWKRVNAMLTLLDEDAGFLIHESGLGTNVEDFLDEMFREYRSEKDVIWSVLQEIGNQCLPNIFTRDCASDHLEVFKAFPPVQGPAMEGEIMDFLGISTSFSVVCTGLHLFLAPGRSLDCFYAAQNRPLRYWPFLDEEYLEWADLLAAATAAPAQAPFRVAEIGAGRIGIWAVRAVKAFLSLRSMVISRGLLVGSTGGAKT